MPWMRRTVAKNKATEHGAEAGCVFCTARIADPPVKGELAFVLSGTYCGEWGRVEEVEFDPVRGGITIAHDHSRLEERIFCAFDQELVAKLDDLIPPPHWLPSLRLEHLARFEEFIAGFSSGCFVGRNFAWSDEAAQEAIHGLWWNMTPASGADVARAAVAHGMPSHFQDRLSTAFEFSRACLIVANKRRPRSGQLKPNEVSEQFSQALRFSYYWHNL